MAKAGETPKQKPAENTGQSQSPETASALQRAQTMLRRAEERLKPVSVLAATAVDKPKPGFARLPEKPELADDLEHMSVEERFNLLKEALGKKEMSEEQVLRIEQLSLLRDFTEVVAETAHGEIPITQEIYAKPKQWFAENFSGLVAKVLSGEEFTLKGLMPENLERLMTDSGVPFDVIATHEQLLKRQNLLVTMARKHSAYGAAEAVIERALADEFKKGVKMIDAQAKLQVNADAAADITVSLNKQVVNKGVTYNNAVDFWRSQGMTEAQIEETRQQMIEAEYRRGLQKEAAKKYLGESINFSGTKAKLWKQYVDMLDPKKHWLEVSDKTWDFVKQEIIINAPLIVVSGGIANLAKAGFTLAVRGAARASLRTAAGMLIEGAAFDVVHRVLSGGEWYKDLPDFAQSVLWSSATLGLFHGAGRLAEGFFSREITLAGGEKLQALTYLGRQVRRLEIKGKPTATKALQETVKTLLVKGHTEAATMLLVGAMQNGCYTGDLDDFMKNFGDELLHAYVVVGALKTSGHVTGKIQQKLMPIPQMRVEEDVEPFIQPGQSPDMRAERAESIEREVVKEKRKRARSKKEKPAEKSRATILDDKYDLDKLYVEKALPLILKEIEASDEGKSLSRKEKMDRAEQEWDKFLEKLFRIYNSDVRESVDVLLDFDATVSKIDGKDLLTWSKRMEAADAEVREPVNEVLNAYNGRIRELPEEADGRAEARVLYAKAKDSLTFEERQKPQHEQRAIVRARFYEAINKIAEASGKLMDVVELFVRNNPFVLGEQILEEAKKNGFDDLPASVRKNIRIAVLRFERNREVIRQAKRIYTPAELFEQVFGFRPYDNVSYAESTFALQFAVSPVDYLRAYDERLSSAPVSTIEQRLVEQGGRPTSGGFKTRRAGKLSALEGLVNVVWETNWQPAQPEIFTHEEAHTMYDQYFSLGGARARSERVGYRTNVDVADRKYEKLETRREVLSQKKIPRADVERVIDLYLKSYLDRAKDEICAFLTDGSPTDVIQQYLTATGKDALYDYPAELQGKFGRYVPDSVLTAAGYRYRGMVVLAITRATRLLEVTRTSAERTAVIAKLKATPIDRWEMLYKAEPRLSHLHQAEANYPVETAVERLKIEVEELQYLHTSIDTVVERIKKGIDLLRNSEDRVHAVRESGILIPLRETVRSLVDTVTKGDRYDINLHIKFFAEIEKCLYDLPPEIALIVRNEILLPEVERIEDIRSRVQVKDTIINKFDSYRGVEGAITMRQLKDAIKVMPFEDMVAFFLGEGDKFREVQASTRLSLEELRAAYKDIPEIHDRLTKTALIRSLRDVEEISETDPTNLNHQINVFVRIARLVVELNLEPIGKIESAVRHELGGKPGIIEHIVGLLGAMPAPQARVGEDAEPQKGLLGRLVDSAREHYPKGERGFLKIPALTREGRLRERVEILKVGDVVVSRGGAKIEVIEMKGDLVSVEVTDASGKVHMDDMSRNDFAKVDWIDRIETSQWAAVIDRYAVFCDQKGMTSEAEFLRNPNAYMSLPRRGLYHPSLREKAQYFRELLREEARRINSLAVRETFPSEISWDTVEAYAVAMRRAGMAEEANIILDRNARFSSKNGKEISTLEQRIEYAGEIMNLAVKEFNAQFTLAVTVPSLVEGQVSSFDAVLEIHKSNMEGWDQTKDYGRTKDIGGQFRFAGEEVIVGDHSPPFSREVPKLMADFSRTLDRLIEEVIRKNNETPDVVQKQKNAVAVATWAHQKLVDIHPFFGGNGRTARCFFDYVFQKIMQDNLANDVLPYRYIPIDRSNLSISPDFNDFVATKQQATFPNDPNADRATKRETAREILANEFGGIQLDHILGDQAYQWYDVLNFDATHNTASDRFHDPKIFRAVFEYESSELGIPVNASTSDAFMIAFTSAPAEFQGFFLKSPQRNQMVESLLADTGKKPDIPNAMKSLWKEFQTRYNQLRP